MVIDVDALEELISNVRSWPDFSIAHYLAERKGYWLKPEPVQLSPAGRMEIMQRQVMQKPVEKEFDPYFDPVPEGEAWVFYSRKHNNYIVRPGGVSRHLYYSSRSSALDCGTDYCGTVIFKGMF